jgi:hypothetical protein
MLLDLFHVEHGGCGDPPSRGICGVSLVASFVMLLDLFHVEHGGYGDPPSRVVRRGSCSPLSRSFDGRAGVPSRLKLSALWVCSTWNTAGTETRPPVVSAVSL